MSAPTVPAASLLRHARRHAFGVLWAAYGLVFLVNAAVNTAVVRMDYARLGRATEAWQIPLWEWSSGLMFVGVVPLVIWAEQQLPLVWGQLRRHLAAHLGLSVVFSLLHVGGMVTLREAGYFAWGLDYDFGAWPRELVYEYLKDVRVYALLLLTSHYLRLLLRRSSGEARLLDARDDGVLSDAAAPQPEPDRLLVRKLGREFLVPAADIEYAVAAGNYVNLHVRGKEYPLRSTVTALEARLDPECFQRVHRGVIVNLKHLSKVEPLEGGEARLHMADGAELPCSRRYRAQLRERHRAIA
jgi:hypothetical protein